MERPDGRHALVSVIVLGLMTAAMAGAVDSTLSPELVLIVGLGIFGAVFAINSAVHSFLIVAFADDDKVAMNVGFYYLANAAGRLTGTLLSGWVYQLGGMAACLWVSAAFLAVSALLCVALPSGARARAASSAT